MAENPDFKNDLKKMINFFKGLGIFGVLIVLGLYLSTGIYTVGPDEEAVLLRLGKYSHSTGPGLHWFVPAPFGDIYKIKVRKRYNVELGYRLVRESSSNSSATSRDVREESYMLTGDENIVAIDATVLYEIKSAKDFLFNVRDPKLTVKNAAEAAIRQIVGNADIDTVLTEGKDLIQVGTKEKLQEILNNYNTGIIIFDFLLQDVKPPENVESAFKDVASAREDRQRFIKEAERYKNEVVLSAEGSAAAIEQRSEAYKVERINEAKGEVTRFLQMYEKYEIGKEVTKTRLYLETMEKIMPNIDKVIIDDGAKNGVLNILNKEGGLK